MRPGESRILPVSPLHSENLCRHFRSEEVKFCSEKLNLRSKMTTSSISQAISAPKVSHRLLLHTSLTQLR